MNRSAGILLSVSSLPSKYGIGCFSTEAYKFVDWLVDAGQTYWQILPLGPTGYGKPDNSPYESFSAFAGNPYYINIEALIGCGLLTSEECDAINWGKDPEAVDYDLLHKYRYELLHKAYERCDLTSHSDYQRFISDNSWWLSDYALFMALKDFFKDSSWTKWPEDIRLHWGNAVDYYRHKLYFDIEFHQFLQYLFFRDWWALKEYANKRGIKIIGDMPIYVSLNSSDVWSHPELFQLDSNNVPTAVAGCPPDCFSADGQIWGTPLYRWDYHRNTGFDWWCSRLWQSFRMYDVLRIDHFRAFADYFSIPYGSTSALNGHWEKGPGIDLFNTAKWRMGDLPVIVEDLGLLTDSVRQLVWDTGFPNMKVIQFAFDPDDEGAANDYLTHNYNSNCVVYTGTHDNDTLIGWISNCPVRIRQMVRNYLCDPYTPIKSLNIPLIGLAMRSKADTCIIPMQDYLGLDNKSRMNIPSATSGSWRWRMKKNALTPKLNKEILSMTKRFGRFNWNGH